MDAADDEGLCPALACKGAVLDQAGALLWELHILKTID